MITVFNRKSLTSTVHPGMRSKIEDVLAKNKIDYYLKISNLADGNIVQMTRRTDDGGLHGNHNDYTREYKFYVRKSEHQKALNALRDIKTKAK